MRLEDVLLMHYMNTMLWEQISNYPAQLAIRYAACFTPSSVDFKRVIALTALHKRVTVFESSPGLVRFNYKHTQDRSFAFVDGSPSWNVR